MAERLKAHAWKACIRQKRIEGSNPSLSVPGTECGHATYLKGIARPLVYVAAVAGVLHHWWLVKNDLTFPILYGLVLIAWLLPRFWWAATRPRTRRAPMTRPA